MTSETSRVSLLIREARAEVASPTERKSESQIIPVKLVPRSATVLLKRPFRDAAYVRRHVGYVVAESAEQGEQHIVRNLLSIRRRLNEMGLDRDVVDREIRDIESAVRAELWRQILLPDEAVR